MSEVPLYAKLPEMGRPWKKVQSTGRHFEALPEESDHTKRLAVSLTLDVFARPLKPLVTDYCLSNVLKRFRHFRSMPSRPLEVDRNPNSKPGVLYMLGDVR